MSRLYFLCILPIVFLLSACASTQSQSGKFCESPDLLVDAMFEAGNFSHCTVANNGDVSIVIAPEDSPPINRSPWYSFRLNPARAMNVALDVSFIDGYARYWPKISTDGKNFTRLPENQVTHADDGESMTLQLHLTGQPVWISAQERLLPGFYSEWIRELSTHPDVTTRTLGRSVLGRPIYVARSGTGNEAVFLFGRQHPPEVSGAFAMKSFVDTVMADTALAQEFRRRFTVFMIPLINPDGVVLGHWRHNVNGVDLNRDWGPFTQPETQGIARLLATLEQQNVRPKLMLDFHSTRESLFYTQMPDDEQNPSDFASIWLSRARERLPHFEFKHDPRPPSGQENTKNFFYSRYDIPAITYEIGDEVDRVAISNSTPVFAEEMMRLMLER